MTAGTMAMPVRGPVQAPLQKPVPWCLLIRTALLVVALNGWSSPALAQTAAAQDQAAPAGGTVVAQGEYLARAGDCIACHTKPGGKLFAGGRAMPTPFGTLYTSNITPDPSTGIGKWSADAFYGMMHTGRSPDGGLLYPAMPFGAYTKVTRADSDAIFAYLRQIQPV